MSQTLKTISTRLKPGGVLLATIRDYDSLLSTLPSVEGPTFFSECATRRIVHQVWDWNGNQYDLHLYLTWKLESLWISKHYTVRYRAITRAELTSGFKHTASKKSNG